MVALVSLPALELVSTAEISSARTPPRPMARTLIAISSSISMGSAAAITDCDLLRIEKKAMMDALHREHTFSDMFVAYLLARNIRYEEDLVDQLFNSSEKRLARLLLMLAHFGKEGVPETVVPKISQETLAEMVGTTRSRVSFFMDLTASSAVNLPITSASLGLVVV